MSNLKGSWEKKQYITILIRVELIVGSLGRAGLYNSKANGVEKKAMNEYTYERFNSVRLLCYHTIIVSSE